MGYITFDQLKSTVTKLKNYIDAKKATVTQTITSGTEIGSVDGTKLYAPSGGSGAVSSVNGKTGAVQLTASDVGAKPSSYTAPVSSVNGQTGAVQLALGDSVAVTQKQTSGTNIADLEINGVTTQLFAPSGGGSTTLTRIKTTSINLPQQKLKDDANNMQPVFLQITCDDTFTYACFGLCHAEIDNGVMLVYVHQLWGHAYKRVFGQSTGTLREILPLLTVPFSTIVENFTIPATLVSGNVYEVSGDATFKSQYIRGTYAYRESTVSLT